MQKELVLYTDGELNIEVQLSLEEETVWLTQKQIELLFDVSHATVSEHISNILSSGELGQTSVGFSDRSTGGRWSCDCETGCRKFCDYHSETLMM